MLAVAHDWRAPIAVVLAGSAGAVVLSWFAQVNLPEAVASLIATCFLGYVSGSLLVHWREEEAPLAWACIRLIIGLLLSTLGFLTSLVFALPWFLGPAVVLIGAVAVRRSSAFALPHPRVGLRWDGAVAGLLAVALVSPIVTSAMLMAPGDYPPVFYSVDTPYTLEKTHALVKTSRYPPESLSNLGGRPIYHLGIQGMAALIARTSGIAPHHSLFLIVLPILALGSVAAARVVARGLSPQLPAALTVPLLLTSVPSFWYSFSAVVWPELRDAVLSRSLAPLGALTGNYQLWGAASIVCHNVGAQFLVLASLAGLGVAGAHGWWLPVVLIGTAIVVKAPTGVALLSGLLLAQAWRAVETRTPRPLRPAIAAATVFAVTYVVFFVVPSVPVGYKAELFPFFHLSVVDGRAGLPWLGVDLVWLLLPALVVWRTTRDGSEQGNLAFLAFGLAPLVVVNLTRSLDVRPGAGGATDDWLQILLPVPVLLHAFALKTANTGWPRSGLVRRWAFLALATLAVVPSVFVAARYSRLLLRHPREGHEFVDNRSIAQALATIPVQGSVLVTNDLRYPAQGFSRNNRQMQIPSLFGHQAFAVNSAYEAYDFSDQRGALQALLQTNRWSQAIDEAARAYGWTHLLIRKDYIHPRPIPFDAAFENESYAVYRFPK